MLTELMEKYSGQLGITATHEAIASFILDEIKQTGSYEDLLPCLVSWVSAHRRLAQIPLENKAFDSVIMENLTSDGLNLDSENAARWKANMDKMVCVRPSTTRDPGLWKAWKDMTIQDHLDRIESQERRIEGLRLDQEKHRKAIALIEKFNVTCLGEIPVQELVQV